MQPLFIIQLALFITFLSGIILLVSEQLTTKTK